MFDLNNQIKNVSFNDTLSCSGCYYYKNKELMINFNELLQFYKMDIISSSTLFIEFFTLLLHEIIHAMQYKMLVQYDKTVMSKMKKLSIELKDSVYGNISKNHLFPDER